MNKKPQTIQGFLTPNKLLSITAKNIKSKNSKSPKAATSSFHTQKQTINNSRYNSQNQSLLNTSRQIDNRVNLRQGVSIIEEDDKNRYITNKSRTLEEINNRKWESVSTGARYDTRPIVIGNPSRPYQKPSTANFTPIIQSDNIHSSNKSYQNPNIQPFFSTSQPIKKPNQTNQQVMIIQCYQLIRKLSKIKQNLELQISQLQTLLDNTSKYMDNMDDEFTKIKQNILSYTARCLDSAFLEYKQNMVEWQKYQDFQRKSLTMLTEMNQYMYNQERKLSENQKITYREMTDTALQLEGQIDYYGQFTEQIRRIRDQCISMRPTMTEDRIKQFEKGLAILCNF